VSDLLRGRMLLRPALAVAAAVAMIAVVHPLALGGPGTPALPVAPSAISVDTVPVPEGAEVSQLAPAATLQLELSLTFSNASRLAGFLASVSDPTSSEYRHFLTYAEFQSEYGPSPEDVNEVESTLTSAGAHGVSLVPGGLAVEATLPVRAAEQLLGVTMVSYTDPSGTTGFTALGPVRLPEALQGRVQGIDGLAGVTASALTRGSLAELSPARPVGSGAVDYVAGNGTPPGYWYLGSDYTQAYGATSLLPGSHSVVNATFPTHVAIATLLVSGYNAPNLTVLPPWTPSVIDDYFNDSFPANGSWPLPTLTGVPLAFGGVPAPPPPGSFHGENDTTGFTVENSLDLEMAGSLAPGASLYNFYFSAELAENPASSVYIPQYLGDELGAAVAYNYGSARLAVVSCSFGLNDLNDSVWDTYLAAAAATGVTVVAASGDQGDAPSALTGRAETAWPLWPATAAFATYGAISVGGASLELSGIPTGTYVAPPLNVSFDPHVDGIANASAWWDVLGGPGHYAGTEGGTSLLYPEPSWQFHSAAQPPIVNATEIEGFPRLGRAGPDVAFSANSTIAFVAAAANGTPYFELLGGTSIAAPLFGGLLADVAAVQGGVGLGFLDPELYRIASYYQAYPGSSDPFLPVVYGGNALFSAAPGWNPTTGWGGLYAPLFLAALENANVSHYTYTGPTPTLPGTTPASLSPETIVLVLVAAVAVVVAIAAVLVSRSRRVPPTLPTTGGPYGGTYAGPSAPARAWPPQPPTGPVATFSCPYCGFDRPAEPGPCPRCGAM